MDNLYGRKIEVVTANGTFSGDDLSINFTVPFDDGVEPNIAEIEIYNLSDKTITGLKKGEKVTLNAGYKNDVGSIFLGLIQLPQTAWNSLDRITKLECIDSGETWFKEKVKKTYKAGVTGKQILNDLLPMTKLVIGALELPADKVYQSGKSVDGFLMDIIAEVAKDCGAKAQVNKNKIFVRKQSAGDSISFTLDKDHGLIGSPTPIEKEVKYNVVEKVETTKKEKGATVTTMQNKSVEKTKTVHGWKIVSLLNHRITTDVIINIISKTANGVFRVESGTHKGSSYGNNFYTEIEVYPL